MLRAGGSVALSEGLQREPLLGRRAALRGDDHDRDPRHGHVHARPAASKPDDADNPLRTVYMGPLSRHKEFARALRRAHLHGVRDDRGAGADHVSRSTPTTSGAAACNAAPGHYELRLVDENDVPVPPNTPGELDRAARAPVDDQLGLQEHAGGDRRTPGATAGSTPATSSRRTRTGNFFFLDRIKDVIRRRGENISSFEVETEVMTPSARQGRRRGRGQEPRRGGVGRRRGGQGRRRARGRAPTLDPAELVEYLAARMPRVLGAALHRVPPGAAAHGVAQGARRPTCARRAITAGTWDREKAGVKLKREVADLSAGRARSTATARLVAGAVPRRARALALPAARPLPGLRRRRRARCCCRARGTLWTWTTQGFEPKPPYVADGRVRAVRRRLRRVPGLPPRRGAADRERSGAAADRHADAGRRGRARRRRRRTRSRRRTRRDRDRDRRRRHPPVRPARGRQRRSRWACTRCAPRSPTPGSRGATSQFAYGGSEDGGNADTMVSDLGPTGLPFINVKNGCATGGSSLVSAVRALAVGRVRRRARRRLRQASARRVPERSRRLVAARRGTARIGLMVTTQFFGAKLQRYMHDHGDPGRDARAGRGEGVRERLAHAARVAAHAAVGRRDPRLADARPPADAVHAVLAGRGGGRARRLPARVPRRGCRTRGRCGCGRSSFRTRRPGSFEVFSPSLAARDRAVADGRRGARGVRGGRRRARATSTSCRCRTPSRARS